MARNECSSRRRSSGDPFHVSRIHEALASGYERDFRRGKDNRTRLLSSPHGRFVFPFGSYPHLFTGTSVPRATATATRRVSPSFFPSLSLSLSFPSSAKASLFLSRTRRRGVKERCTYAREGNERERERVGDQVSSVKKKSHCTGASDRGVGR